MEKSYFTQQAVESVIRSSFSCDIQLINFALMKTGGLYYKSLYWNFPQLPFSCVITYFVSSNIIWNEPIHEKLKHLSLSH